MASGIQDRFFSGVSWAYLIKSFETYKVLNSDRVYSIMLQREQGVLFGLLTKVLRASIALRHFFREWSDIRVTIISKSSHVLAKDFKLISLSSFILKALKRLIDR